jgi:hypothetical protein
MFSDEDPPLYRYELGGNLDPQFSDFNGYGCWVRSILWIMLNPSTADAMKDDQTIGTIGTFSELWGYNRIVVCNAYAYRATDPKVMFMAQRNGVDIIGPSNNEAIAKAVQQVRQTGGRIMAAWGKNAKLARVKEVHNLAGEMWCLKFNKDGSPVHPLYQPHSSTPVIWQGMP